MKGKPLVWLNVRQTDKSENVNKVENVQKINKSLVSYQMKMFLTEKNTKNNIKGTRKIILPDK